MAKKTTAKKEGQLPDPLKMMQKIDENIEVLQDSVYSKIDDYISSGIHILDCMCTGSAVNGGIPSSRCTVLTGDPGTGKTYLACSFVREAQKKNYYCLWLDSEGAMDNEFMERLGIDTSKVMIKQVSTVLETSQVIINLCKQLEDQEEEYGEHHKFMIVLDSLGNLTTDSERDNTMAGENKRDLKRAQDVKAHFRVIATPIARMKIPYICISHQYASIGSYIQNSVVSGGSGVNYNSSLTIELTASKLSDKDNDNAASKAAGSDDLVKTGVLVTARPKKSRFTIPRKVRFQIPFFKKPNPYVGLDSYLGDWNLSGVCRGSLLTEKDYNKLSEAEKAKIHIFDFNGQTMYCQPKDTARGIVVRHLGKTVPLTEFFTDEVFTPEYLAEIDEKILKPTFKLPSADAFDDIKEIEDIIEIGENTENDE